MPDDSVLDAEMTTDIWCSSLRQAFATKSPELLFIDLDGTLVDSVPDLANALNHTLELMGMPTIPVSKVTTFVGNGADQLVRRGLAQGDETLANQLDEDIVAEARAVFDQAYLSCLTRATGIYPGVSEFLTQMTDHAMPMILVTNKPRLFTLPLLRALGWSNIFTQVICGDDLAERKPSAVPLLTGLQRYNESLAGLQRLFPENCLMIGDSVSDFRAAQAASVFSVAVTYGYNHGSGISTADGDYQVDNLMHLLER